MTEHCNTPEMPATAEEVLMAIDIANNTNIRVDDVPIRLRRVRGMDAWLAYQADSAASVLGHPAWGATRRGALIALWERVVPPKQRSAMPPIDVEQLRVTFNNLLDEYAAALVAFGAADRGSAVEIEQRAATHRLRGQHEDFFARVLLLIGAASPASAAPAAPERECQITELPGQPTLPY